MQSIKIICQQSFYVIFPSIVSKYVIVHLTLMLLNLGEVSNFLLFHLNERLWTLELTSHFETSLHLYLVVVVWTMLIPINTP